MTNFKPDPTKRRSLILSNDAFFYLYRGEDLIDEDNLDEVQEVESYFPCGYTIQEPWNYVGTDLVEAVFVPLIIDGPKENQSQLDFDGENILSPSFVMHIKLSDDKKRVKLWYFNSLSNIKEYKGEFELKWNKSHKFVGFSVGDWRIGKGTLVWLKSFKELRPGALSLPPNLPSGL